MPRRPMVARKTALQSYQIEELNPFLEWHLHGTTDNRHEALIWGNSLCQKIRRSVRILDASKAVVAQFDAD